MTLSHRALPRSLPKNRVLLRTASFYTTRYYLNSLQDTRFVVNTSRSSSSSAMAPAKSSKFGDLRLAQLALLTALLPEQRF